MNLYVIGAVTGMPKDNLSLFNQIRGELMEAGYRVDIPHDNINAGTPWKNAMAKSISRICDHMCWNGDNFGIAMLDGWENSKGATIEHDLAEALDITCKPWREWI